MHIISSDTFSAGDASICVSEFRDCGELRHAHATEYGNGILARAVSKRCPSCPPEQVLRASAGVTGTGMHAANGDKEEIGYKTFLGHLYDLLEEKINTERYEEGVRQLVGNQVRGHAKPATCTHLGLSFGLYKRPQAIFFYFFRLSNRITQETMNIYRKTCLPTSGE